MKGMTRAVLAGCVGTILAVSAAPPAPAAVSSLEVQSGTLEARGLEASVPVTFVCDEGALYELGLNVSQIVQQKTITGAGAFTSGRCTGETQTVNVDLRPVPKPFKKGAAVADAYVNSYCYVPEWGYEDYCGGANVALGPIRLR